MQLAGTCPPDPPWLYTTPPTYSYFPMASGTMRPTMWPSTVAYEPYGTESRLRGLGILPIVGPVPQISTQKMRWDIIGLVGGGTLLVALTLGFLATR